MPKIKSPVDLALFIGQSNMGGRGDAAQAPIVPVGQGYEFRAVSDPGRLYDVVEPFGCREDRPGGLYEPGQKTGSLVSAFMRAYYSVAKAAVVGVSASKGGISIDEWQPGGAFLADALSRWKTAEAFLRENGIPVRKKFIVWCQGESDGDKRMPAAEYKEKLKKTFDALLAADAQVGFLIRIGNHRDLPQQYAEIIRAQTEFCREYENAVLVSGKMASMAARGLMKDVFHYKQAAYNEVGEEAGQNAAAWFVGSRGDAN